MHVEMDLTLFQLKNAEFICILLLWYLLKKNGLLA